MRRKRSRGRPTKYRPDYVERAAKLWQRGCTDLEVAKKLKTNHETLSQWCERYPLFLAAKKAAKAVADQLVEHALFSRATGIVLPDCHVSTHEGQVTVTPLQRHYPPDPVSMIFWLKNRKPKEWRDRMEVDANVTHELDPKLLAAARALAIDITSQTTTQECSGIVKGDVEKLSSQKLLGAGPSEGTSEGPE